MDKKQSEYVLWDVFHGTKVGSFPSWVSAVDNALQRFTEEEKNTKVTLLTRRDSDHTGIFFEWKKVLSIYKVVS